MILRMLLEAHIAGYWDGGTREYFDFVIDGPRQHDGHGPYVRVGSWGANYWCQVALGKTATATLGHARRHLAARAKRAGYACRFVYLTAPANTYERTLFGGNPDAVCRSRVDSADAA